jgi:PilZ domain
MMSEFDVQPVLTQELSVRVVNLSAGGCLVESRQWIEVGTIARLQLQVGTEVCEDDVEVVRCETIGRDPALYRLGVRLLRTRPRQPGSIRHAVARHAGDLDRSGIDNVN